MENLWPDLWQCMEQKLVEVKRKIAQTKVDLSEPTLASKEKELLLQQLEALLEHYDELLTIMINLPRQARSDTVPLPELLEAQLPDAAYRHERVNPPPRHTARPYPVSPVAVHDLQLPYDDLHRPQPADLQLPYDDLHRPQPADLQLPYDDPGRSPPTSRAFTSRSWRDGAGATARPPSGS